MFRGKKYKRKDGTIIWSSNKQHHQNGSVIAVPDHDAKQMKYFMFVSNPKRPQEGSEAIQGKTTLLGSGLTCRVKFILPVRLENNKFILAEEKSSLQVVKIASLKGLQNESFPEIQFTTSPLFFKNEKKLYFITEYKGETLMQVLRRAKQSTSLILENNLLNLKQYLQLIVDILKEIQSYHNKNIIIGDLHDSNIAILKFNERIIPSIIDFDKINSRTHVVYWTIEQCIDSFKKHTLSFMLYHPVIDEIIECIDKVNKSAYPENDTIDIPYLLDLYSKILIFVKKKLSTSSVEVPESEGILYQAISNYPELQPFASLKSCM